jgi:nucleotide-binding universal stress UspA family protein
MSNAISFTFKRILIPLDGSSLAERALPATLALSQKFNSQIILLRVLDIPTLTGPTSHSEVTIGWVREARQQAHDEARSYLEAIEGKLGNVGIDTRILLRDRSPAADILDVAADEGIDLIVISSHGEDGPARWAFGNVAEKVTLYSTCPVLLVRQDLNPASESK